MHILIQGCFKLNWVCLKYSWTGKGQLKASSCEIYNRLIKADALCIISNFWLVRSLDFFYKYIYIFSSKCVCIFIYIYIIFFKYIPICTLTLRTFCFCSPCISVTCSAVHRVAFQMQCIINSWCFAKQRRARSFFMRRIFFANWTSSISQWNFLMLPYYSCTKLLGSYRSNIKTSN